MEKYLSYFGLYIILLIFMLFIDYIWLKTIVGGIVHRELSSLANIVDGKIVIKYIPALITYLLMALCILVFVLPLADTYPKAAMFGVLMGVIVYGVYELTNLTFIKNYSMTLVYVDILWGAILFGLSSPFALWLTKVLN